MVARRGRVAAIAARNGDVDGQEEEPYVEPEVSSGQAWKLAAVSGEKYKLPGSGLIVRLRRPGLMALIAKAGASPNPLSAQVIKFLSDLGEGRLGRGDEAEQLKVYKANTSVFIEIARLCFVYPRIANDDEEPDWDGVIPPEAIADYDYTWLAFSFMEGALERIEEFRVSLRPGETRLPSATLRDAA